MEGPTRRRMFIVREIRSFSEPLPQFPVRPSAEDETHRAAPLLAVPGLHPHRPAMPTMATVPMSRAEQPNRTMMIRESAGRRGRYLPCATTQGQIWTRSSPNSRPEGESNSPRENDQRAFTTVGQQLPAYLMVCPVTVAAENGKSECQATLLLDPGSHVDCADAALIRRLNPKKTGSAPLEIQVFGGKKIKMPSGKYWLQLKRTDGEWESLEVSEVEKICTPIKTELISPGATPDRFQTTTVTTQPQLLIGIRKFWDFVQGFRKSEEGAYLIDTVFGTVLCGERFQAATGVTPDPTVFAIAPCGDDEREQMPAVKAVEQFWSLETIGIRDDPTNDADAEAVIQFERSVQQQNDGRYSIRLPWREEFPALPTNYSVAYRRLIGMLQRLQRTPEVLKQYQQTIDDQLQSGVIEETTIGTGQREYFIPHQAVITPKKLRIVYDASAHAKGVPSLNDCLLRGPVWLPDLAGMLIRFRACQVPVIADVEKAFLMVGIEEADREMCKFLWVRDPSAPITTQNLASYRFRRLAFGLTPSPFCLAAVVRHHLRKYGSNFAEQLIRDTYVDNVLIPADSLDEAAAKAKEAKEMFAAAKMNLREFLSNNSVLNNSFSEADFLGKTTAKMLGLEWDAACVNTRRAVLKTIASLFDPLGFLAPATLTAKQFFQKLWDSTHGWEGVPSPVSSWQNLGSNRRRQQRRSPSREWS
uniref:Reverse transcriptase domain-containing protein n=1 Tax=Globodera rostochiensis TaxID=31243 RepID=A0A914H5L7_GLORO